MFFGIKMLFKRKVRKILLNLLFGEMFGSEIAEPCEILQRFSKQCKYAREILKQLEGVEIKVVNLKDK